MFVISFNWSLYEKYHQCLWCQKSCNEFEKKYLSQKIISASDGKTRKTYLLKMIISASDDKRRNNFDEKIASASYDKTPEWIWLEVYDTKYHQCLWW